MTGSEGRRRLTTDSPWEAEFGYCRALRVADRILVAGCGCVEDGRVTHPADPMAQARVALRIGLDAVAELGGRPEDVVRTRMYLTHRRDCEDVGRVHGEVFGATPPVSTMIVVAGLVHPDMCVEIEMEAVVAPEGAAPAQDDDPASDDATT